MTAYIEHQRTIGHVEDCLYEVMIQLPKDDIRRLQIESLLPIMSDLYHSFDEVTNG